MVKKGLALLLILVMVASMMACGKKEPESSTSTPAGETGDSSSTEETGETTTDLEPITYTFLNDWNGGAFSFPDGWNEGPVAKEIEAKTGVNLVVETITSSETEKLALVFASGDVPDITNAPFWSTNPGGEGEQIKKAALDGMLLDLNDYVEQFPNIKRAMTENISGAFRELHLENSDFGGSRYIIPNKPMTEEDNTNWAYGVFARKDILEALGVEPSSITTADQLYDLLKKINGGGFTDTNGKPVISAGNWHNGWSYDQYLLTFAPGGFTGWDMLDGRINSDVMLPNEIDKILYMRKLVSEGLYDSEGLTQTDTLAKEKMATGRIATFGCHWPHMNGFFESTLYVTNPEMEYVTLGPFVQKDGSNPTSVYRKGAYGFGCLFLSADVEQPERALGLIEYLTGDEGWLLSRYGIEGEHFNYEGDIPVLTEEWKTVKSQDQQRFYLQGFGFSSLSMDDRNKSYGWDEDYNKPGYVTAREIRQIAYFDGFTADDISSEWPGKAEYNEAMATSDYSNIKKVAITAASDEEAVALIEEYRQKMRAAGYDEMMDYVQEKMDADPTIVY